MSSKDYLLLSWDDHARTLYLKALRGAVAINPTSLSQQHGAKKQKVAASGLSLFRGDSLRQSEVIVQVSLAHPYNAGGASGLLRFGVEVTVD